MKKFLLLLSGSCLALGANAQYAKSAFTNLAHQQKKVAVNPSDLVGFVPNPNMGTARTTAAAFWTETFGTGTGITLPTGWTAGSLVGTGTWHWTNHACTGTYNIGVIASTTASDGWMVYDSDSIGGTTVKPSGWLQSPSIPCTGHTTVRLNFQEKYREFQDSCQVWVCHTAGGAPTWAAGSYTSYNVYPNNNMDDNTSTLNPQNVHIDITGQAANQANVYVRFVYYDNYAGGSFNWLLDDINLSELDPTDVSISSTFMYNAAPTLSYSTTIFNTPLEFVDSVSPTTFLSNVGANTQTVALNAVIYQGSTSVYTQPATFTGLAYGMTDTSVVFPKYLPNAIGNYFCTVTATVAGDADLSNNVDTVKFNVTDTTWQENLGLISGGYYVYRASSSTAYYTGTRFDVPASAVGDTVSGFGVSFASASLPTGTGKVSVQIYSHSLGVTGWDYVGTSVERPVTSADISTTGSTVWADFRSDPIVSGGYLILAPGKNYAAVVQVNGLSTDLLVQATPSPNATPSCGYFGQAGASGNDGLTTFGAGTDATGLGSTPLVRMYFGHVSLVGVNQENVLVNMVGKAYPNPSNTEVNVPFTLNADGNVIVTLTDVIGQSVDTKSVIAKAGQSTKATFNTSTLASGVYLYTVKVNGEQTTGRIVVAH